MDFENRVRVQGSEIKPLAGLTAVESASSPEDIRVTLVLKSRDQSSVAGSRQGIPRLTRAQFARTRGANSDTLAKVREFALQYQLKVIESDPVKRRVVLSGNATAISRAFGTRLNSFTVANTGRTFHVAEEAPSVPGDLAPGIEAVLGLDSRPVVAPRSVINRAAAAVTFTPPQIALLYKVPSDAKGAGQTIAILQFGGGFNYPDLDAYFTGLGLNSPNITAISVEEARNSPGSQADLEVMLDIEIAGAVANDARIDVYFAPNTDQGFTNAILDAVHNEQRPPSVISISWGAAEDAWSGQARTAVNSALRDAATLGITVLVASGDSGSSDGQGDRQFHVDFPASSPYVVACGGTTLTPKGDKIESESVWHNDHGATGGGVSVFFARPAYQNSALVPTHPRTGFAGRGVPDVAGNADPATGYRVRVNGADTIVGGTSAVAPLWAGLLAILNQKLGRGVGYINEALYSINRKGFRDIVTGSNDDAGIGAYFARAGWNPCTGLGSPDAARIAAAIMSSGVPSPSPGGTPGNGGNPPPPPPPPPPSSSPKIPFPWDF
jgi:kumamolisin